MKKTYFPLLAHLFFVLTAVVSNAQLPPPCPSNGFPPTDICSDACIYCNFNGISSTTAGYTSQTPPGFCGTIENEQWLGFIAGAGSASFTATPTNCTNGDGIQVALYEACGSTPLACYGGCGNCQGTPASITSGLVIGQNYFLMIDGFAGDQCSFDLSVCPPQAVAAPSIGAMGAIQGPTEVCPGAENVVFTIPPVSGAAIYTWNAPAGSTINGQPPPVEINATDGGNQVTVTFGSAGGQICVRAANSCYTGGQVCKNIIVRPVPPTTFSPVTICFEDIPYITPWGQNVSASGLYTVTFDSWLGCDSVVRQQVTVKSPIINQNTPQAICIGESITVCGEEITEQGPYSVTCQSYQGCDSLVTGLLQVFNPIADILNTGTISCTNPSLTLVSAPTQGIKIWKNAAGQTIGSGNTLTVNAAGTYTLQVIAMSGTVSCTTYDTVVVAFSGTLPNASAAGGTITCALPFITLNGGSTTPGATFAWSGPNGFSSVSEDPLVGAVGSYVLTVTNPADGCTSVATTTVDGSFAPPNASAAGGNLSCATPTVQLNGGSTTSNATFQWSGPGNFTSTLEDPTVSAPGSYALTVTGPNGCSSTATAQVTGSSTPPNIVATGGNVGCGTTSVTLNGGSTTPGVTFRWSGPGGFTSTSEDPAVTAPGSYVLTVTGPNGCTSTATAQVAAITTGSVSASASGDISCTNASVVLSAATNLNAPSYIWTLLPNNVFISNLAAPTVSAPGSYVVSVSLSGNLCPAKDTVQVSTNTMPPQVTTTVQNIDCQNPQGQITTSVPNVPNATFNWSGPNNFISVLQNPTVTLGGNYSVTVTNPTNGCQTIKSVNLSVNTVQPSVSLTNTGISCVTGQGSITTTVSNAPSATFNWSGPNGFTSVEQSPAVSVAGTYTVTVTNTDNHCTTVQQTLLSATFGAFTPILTGGNVTCTTTQISLSANGLPPGTAIYSWTGPLGFTSDLPNPTVSVPGAYYVTITVNGLCIGVGLTSVGSFTTKPSIFNLSATNIDCAHSMANLHVESNVPGATFLWTGPNGFSVNTADATTTQPGIYTIVVTNPANGCTKMDSVTVNVDLTAPQTSITPVSPPVTCLNPTASINLTVSPATGTTFIWAGPGGFVSDLEDPIVVAPGDYFVTVTGANGCTGTRQVNVPGNVAHPIATASGGILTCDIQFITLFASGDIAPLSWKWTGPGSFVSNEQNPTVGEPGIYTVTATAGNGCTGTATAEVLDSCIVAVRPDLTGKPSGLKLYPNPTSGLITVESVTGVPIEILRLFDGKGSLLMMLEQTPALSKQLDLQGYPAGMYHIEAFMEGRWRMAKFALE